MKYTTEIDRGLLRITAAKTFATPAAQIIHKGQQGGYIAAGHHYKGTLIDADHISHDWRGHK